MNSLSALLEDRLEASVPGLFVPEVIIAEEMMATPAHRSPAPESAAAAAPFRA